MAVTYDYYTYHDDTAGVTFVVKMKKDHGDAIPGNTGGATPGPSVHTHKLRHIDGVNNSTNPPTRRRVICCDPTNAVWTGASPGTFSIGGTAYTIVGRIGQKRY